MSPAIQLLMGCLMFSSVVTYAWWSSLRVLILQIDLAAIGQRFRVEMESNGWQDDEACRDFLDSLDGLIRAAPALSASVIGPISRLGGGPPRGWSRLRDHVAGLLGPEAEPFFQLLLDPEVDHPGLIRAMSRVQLRLIGYLGSETIWGRILLAVSFGSRDAGSIIQKWVEESRDAKEGEVIYRYFFGIHHGHWQNDKRPA